MGGRAARGARRPRPHGQTDPRRARHRGRQHLQARHALFRAARRPLPRRGRPGAGHVDGLVRDRPGPHGGLRHRAVRGRAGHLMAARRGALRRGAGDARQAGRGSALALRPPLRRAARARPRRALRRPSRREPRPEVRRRRAARLPAARDDRQEERRGARDRVPSPARPGEGIAAARGCVGGGGGAVADPPLTFRRLVGLDRSAGPPPQTRRGQPLNPWTIPNAIGFARLALVPVFLVIGLSSGDGHSGLAFALFAFIAWSDYFDGMAARITGQYSRLGALLDPFTDRLLVVCGALVAWHYETLPRWALLVLAAREALMLVLTQLALRRGIDLNVSMLGRWAVWPVMSALALALVVEGWVLDVVVYTGLAMTLAATARYLQDGMRAIRKASTST